MVRAGARLVIRSPTQAPLETESESMIMMMTF